MRCRRMLGHRPPSEGTVKIVLLVLIAAIASISSAQQPKSLEQLQREEQLDGVLDTINKAEAALDVFVKERATDCAKAIGYAPFCNCLVKELPIAWSFADYVSITTRTKEENGYAKMTKEYQGAYDKVAPIRDRCVKAINAKR